MSAHGLRSRRSGLISLAVPLALVALAVALAAGSTVSFRGTVTLALCNLVIVCGLQVFIGNSGVYSFGQLGFAMAGGYLAAALTVPAAFAAFQTPGLPSLLAEAELGPVEAVLLAVAGSAALALVVGLPLMRTSTLAIPISTFAFLIVAYNVAANWDGVSGGSGGVVSIPRTTSVVSAGICAALAITVALAYKHSAAGYRLRATREDEAAARSLGIGVMRERMIAFALSAALCGAGGALAVQQSGVLTPNTFYFAATVTTLTMLVLGGATSVLGAAVGTLAVSVVGELLRHLEEGHVVFGLPALGERPGLATIGLGLVLLATMVKLPGGLTGGREAGELQAGREDRPRDRQTTRSATWRSDREDGELLAADVSLAFGGLRVLEGAGLRLGRGEILGLIGPNGAGKTTLVNVISGFQRTDAGAVCLDGEDVTGWQPARLARRGLARSFQATLPFAHLSCLESVAVGAMGVGVGCRRAAAEARAVLGRLGLQEEALSPAGSLPSGTQRLLGVARALATHPRYLLLDEPAAGLNEDESAELVAALRAVVADFGCGLLLIEHDMTVVMELCTQVQAMDEGRTVSFGNPSAVQADPAVIESYLGREVGVGVGA